jgi:2-phospho-L-lactate guanylyltransferase
MTCWALVPVKARTTGKSRLGARLMPAERAALVRQMLDVVIDALRTATSIDAIALVSAERDTVPADIPVLADRGSGLNATLTDARDVLRRDGADEIVVLHADLPLVNGVDVDTLVRAGRRTGCALAPDGVGRGTNALYLPASADFRFHFGPSSRIRHLDEAARLGLAPSLVASPGLSFDVDEPADLDWLVAGQDPRYRLLLSAPPAGETSWPAWRHSQRG